MKKNGGFTLIEIIVTLAVISIMSVGLYQIYTIIIKNTKIAEEKQQSAVVCKRVLEDMKIISSDKFTLSDGKVTVEGIPFIKDGFNEDSYDFNGDEKNFSTTLYLNQFYNYCDKEDLHCTYEQTIVLKKAKSTTGGSDGEEGGAQDVDIDMNVDNIDEHADVINADIKSIDYEYSINKEKDEEKLYLDEENIDNEDGEAVLNIEISKNDSNEAVIIIKDSSGNTLGEKKEFILQDNQVNYLNLHFNFANYYIEEGEEESTNSKYILINVYNRIGKGNDFAANIYIEKSVDVKVDVKACKGDVYKYEFGADKDIKRIGPLYYIDVELKSHKSGAVLFSTRATKNIHIKDV